MITCKALDELGIEYLDSQANFIFMNLKAPLKPFQERMKAGTHPRRPPLPARRRMVPRLALDA